MQRNKIIDLLNDKIAVDFMNENGDKPPETLAMSYSGKVSFNLVTATQLLHLYNKALPKLPSWTKARCALDERSYQQSTSEKVAKFKAGLFTGGFCLDLTSGLGVDSAAFASSFNKVVAFEQNLELFQMQQFNLGQLNITNIDLKHADGLNFDQYVKSKPDLIYLDPDRRPDGDHKEIDLKAYNPVITEFQDFLLAKSDQVLVKLSPMLDLSYLKIQLPNWDKIFVISELKEVKEILVLLKKVGVTKEITAVDIGRNKIRTYCKTTNNQCSIFNGTPSDIKFLFEPAKALIKSELAQNYAAHMDMPMLSKHSHYYVTKNITSGFGRYFQVIKAMAVDWKNIKRELADLKIEKISVAKRNFPESTKIIRKRIGLPDGGKYMMLFSTLSNQKKICFIVERL